jgi:uroporphyrin-III C-methyltransferase
MNVSKKMGSVTLVGAGPGDPELLTLKALKAIQQADVLLVDDLVHDDVIACASANTRVVYVGKRGGCQSTPQAFIEKLMIAEARAGHRVVRLKGGDPFVFGRGGEECASLSAAGIVCTVVNGITAGLAAPTSLGIPLTHRDYCHGAIFVTGHAGEKGAQGAHDKGASEPNWSALVATNLPLVIYMGVARVQALVASLTAAGMPLDMPVAVVQNATRGDQVSLITTLTNLTRDVRQAKIGSPAILIVGRTVALASEIATYAAHGEQARDRDPDLAQSKPNTPRHALRRQQGAR